MQKDISDGENDMQINHSMEQLIGSTPLLALEHIREHLDLKATILAKLESFNPAGSAKDRVALYMLNDAEARGELQPGGTVIEPTSGNTGIGLAAIGAVRGYRVIIVMPDTMSEERIRTIRAYGAEVLLTPGALGMKGSIEKAEELKASIPGSIIAGQFSNPSNPRAHYETTGPEIWRDTEGSVAALVAGVGTGGTISGTGRYLKEKDASVRVIAVEPAASPLLTKGVSGAHGLQGIGANFIPEALDTSVYDEVIPVTEDDAYSMARLICAKEGLMVGISSGAALWAAVQAAKRSEFAGKNIVVILPDTGSRYLSTDLFGGE